MIRPRTIGYSGICYLSVVDGLDEDCGEADGVGGWAGPSLPVPSLWEGHVGVEVS